MYTLSIALSRPDTWTRRCRHHNNKQHVTIIKHMSEKMAGSMFILFNKFSHAKQMIRQVDSTNFTFIKRISIFDCRELPFRPCSYCSFTGNGGSQQFPKRTLAEGSDCGETSEDGRLCSSFERQECYGMLVFTICISRSLHKSIVPVSCLVPCWTNFCSKFYHVMKWSFLKNTWQFWYWTIVRCF